LPAEYYLLARIRWRAPVRLHVVSDLHVEFAAFEPPPVDADVLVLAGDVGLGTAGVRLARSWAAGRPVLFVAGNHEFYRHALPALTGELRAAAAGSAVHVLENDELVLDGVRFLGCTLWSDFLAAGPAEMERSMAVCTRLLNDYAVITHSEEERPLRPADTCALHAESRRWLEERLADGHDGPTVVVTHHAPLVRHPPTNPLHRALAGAFASDLTALMGSDRVDLWIYGHLHRAADLEVAGTRLVSNPRGYPHEPDAFEPGLVVDLDGGRE
jgi:predicted phosphodiesterase